MIVHKVGVVDKKVTAIQDAHASSFSGGIEFLLDVCERSIDEVNVTFESTLSEVVV